MKGHIIGGYLFEFPFNEFFNFLAASLLLFLLFSNDCLYRLHNVLLVALFSYVDDLPHNNVLKFVLKQVNLIAVIDNVNVGHDLTLDLLAEGTELLFIHFDAFFTPMVANSRLETLLVKLLALLDQFFTRISHELFSDFLWQRHHVIKWYSLFILDDLELVLIEDIVERFMFFGDVFHTFFAEDFEDGRSSEAQEYSATLLHEESAVVDDTALEEALNHKLFAFELCIYLNHTALQEIELISVSTRFLELFSFGLCFRLQQVDDVVEDFIVVVEMLEIRDLLHRLFDEIEHFIVVLVNATFHLILNSRLHCDDFLVLLLR